MLLPRLQLDLSYQVSLVLRRKTSPPTLRHPRRLPLVVAAALSQERAAHASTALARIVLVLARIVLALARTATKYKATAFLLVANVKPTK
jgi:hypothetical protein